MKLHFDIYGLQGKHYLQYLTEYYYYCSIPNNQSHNGNKYQSTKLRGGR